MIIFSTKSLYLHPQKRSICYFFRDCEKEALVAELVDALDSKSSDCKIVWVRFPPKVQQTKKMVEQERASKRKLAFF